MTMPSDKASQKAISLDSVRAGQGTSGQTHSGAQMDRKIQKTGFDWRKWSPGIVILLVLLMGGWLLNDEFQGRTFSVESNRINVAKVSSDVFEDFIPLRARVTPRSTVYLDVVEGGRVEQRLVDDGALVQQGQLLVVLSNTSLQLDVVRNEAIVTEQLNNMRSLELQLEQNRLQHRRNLVEIDYQIQRLGRELGRLENLDKSGLASKGQLEDVSDELNYFNSRRNVTLESQATDARLQTSQLEYLRKAAGQLEKSLNLSRNNLDSLNVRAPLTGKLSGFTVEVGQSIERGGRIGQLDDPDNFKLRASLDEFYLNRIDIGQTATVDRGNADYALTVSKIYPQVKNGQFEIDLVFDVEAPEDIRRGQTLQSKLTLGDSTPALLIPNGSFYQDTGGNWIFVLTDDGTQAVRRNVTLGRRNSKFIEVTEGLGAGEQVIVSSYSGFSDMDRLKLTLD